MSRALSPGEVLLASVAPPPGSSCSPPSVKEEPLYPAALHSDIQLLPQQAGMAAILATAVVNSEYSPLVRVAGGRLSRAAVPSPAARWECSSAAVHSAPTCR